MQKILKVVGLAVGVVLLGLYILLSFTGGYGTKLEFNKSTLYYKAPVTEVEAQKLGNHLVKVGYFDETPASVQITKPGPNYELRFVIKSGSENNQDVIKGFKNYATGISRDVFGGAKVNAVLCDSHYNKLKDVPMDN